MTSPVSVKTFSRRCHSAALLNGCGSIDGPVNELGCVSLQHFLQLVYPARCSAVDPSKLSLWCRW